MYRRFRAYFCFALQNHVSEDTSVSFSRVIFQRILLFRSPESFFRGYFCFVLWSHVSENTSVSFSRVTFQRILLFRSPESHFRGYVCFVLQSHVSEDTSLSFSRVTHLLWWWKWHDPLKLPCLHLYNTVAHFSNLPITALHWISGSSNPRFLLVLAIHFHWPWTAPPQYSVC